MCTLDVEAVSNGKAPALALVYFIYIPSTARGKNGWQRRDVWIGLYPGRGRPFVLTFLRYSFHEMQAESYRRH
jgi:hypothetical protein